LGDFSFFVKKLASVADPLLTTAIIAISGTIFLLPFLFYFSKDLKVFIGKNLLFAIFAGILWITIGNVLWVFGVKKIPISIASLLALFYPLFVILLGVIFLQEKITLKFLIASILMIIGYIILVR